MSIVIGLVPLALSRIGDLGGDEAKEATLGVLSRAVNEIPAPPEAIAEAFERILSLSHTLSERAARTRAFGDACEAITVSLLPLSRRRDLLDHALDLALGRADLPERIAMATTALDARIDVRWGERTEEVLADLQRAASAIPDEEGRAAAVLQIASSLARVGETDQALAAIAGLAASARRAIGVARVAFALGREGLAAEAAALIDRALAEICAARPSAERALALRSMLAHAIVTGAELRHGSALAAALDVADALGDADTQRDAVLAALAALPGTTLEGEALTAALTCLDASIDRVDDLDHRVDLRGRLAVSLAALGELDAAMEALRAIADLVSRRRAAGVEGPGVALPLALPIVEILGELADADVEPDDLERFAVSALDLLGVLDDHQGVATLLGEMTRFFASPALAYATRLALLDHTLAVAQSIDADEPRIEVVTHVANALSLGGASERGDGLFAGLVSGVGPRRAREARLSRAVVMVRLGRTADARAEIAAAAAATASTFYAIEELAMTMARCGFLGDMLSELDRIDATRHGEARTQLADGLVEATYLDPHLREIGLSSLLEGTEGPVRETIACLLDQVRVLEGLGDVEAILARAFARTAILGDRRAAAIFDRQLVDALIERIRCAPQETPAPAAAG
jgi:tetratricopeptide (TPR) repeat protein